MGKLNFAQARGHSERMKNVFRSFEFLEETLKTADEASAFMKRATKEIPVLEKKLEGLTVETEKAQKEFAAVEKNLFEEKRRAQDELDKFKARAEAEKEDLQGDLEDYRKFVDDTKESLQQKHEQWLEQIAAEREKATADLEEAKSELQEFVKKIGSE